jgi:hypothetical protein
MLSKFRFSDADEDAIQEGLMNDAEIEQRGGLRFVRDG